MEQRGLAGDNPVYRLEKIIILHKVYYYSVKWICIEKTIQTDSYYVKVSG
jgi:hypothetical protein